MKTPIAWMSSLALAGLAAAAHADDFHLHSPEFEDGGTLSERHVYEGFGCTGENVSPELRWSGAPEGTKSFALLVHDPDAPIASGWWHWVLVNIPADVARLPADAGDPEGGLAPEEAVQVITDFGHEGWGGPCPPEGRDPHRYNFVLHALDVEAIDIPDGASTALVAFLVAGATIDTAELTGLYAR